MKKNCCNYNDCSLPVQLCNNKCELFNKTCWDCSLRIGEECDIDGHEVYSDSVPCDSFSSNED